ncbi:MAG: radical SAM protein, partial [Oscillospiraceae bacterium]|nr:radical SAM protein [Oscillospiraceae bacterium]
MRKQVSQADGTVKYLWRLHDGNAVESVVMRYSYGNTVCISSQVGCRQGCVFCASTGLGFKRDLNAGEMLAEVLFSQIDSGLPVTGIVLMGIGEPLDNYENVMQFLRLLSSKEGRNLSLRHVTLSTCGLVPRILQLAEENLPLTLSVSLHCADNEKRDALM